MRASVDTGVEAAPNGVVFQEVSLQVGIGRARRTLFQDLSAAFSPGEVTCIVGPSGSGKSTLLRTITGLHDPEGGRVLVRGRDVAGLDSRERTKLRRSVVTTIEQDYNLLETLTARENVLLLMQLAGAERRSGVGAEEWLRRLGLWEVREEFPETLSGGERQRVAIARSLACPHPVVLADEPTGALDEANSEMVVGLLGEFAAAGKCCIVATHDTTVTSGADRVLTITQGRLE